MSKTIAASGKDYNNKASDEPKLKRAPFTEKRYIVTPGRRSAAQCNDVKVVTFL